MSWPMNGAIFSDLEIPLTKIKRSRHSVSLNISQTAKDEDASLL